MHVIDALRCVAFLAFALFVLRSSVRAAARCLGLPPSDVDSIASHAWKAAYACWSVWASLTAMSDREMLSRTDLRLNETQVSCTEADYPSSTTTVYAVQACWYCMSIAAHPLLVARDDSQFWMLLAHHVITLYLLGVSWTCGQTMVGLSVLLTHDACDVLLDLLQITRHINVPGLKVVTFLLTLCSWSVLRCWYFPFYILARLKWAGFAYSETVTLGCKAMVLSQGPPLVLLFCANMIWLRKLLRSGLRELRQSTSTDEDGSAAFTGCQTPFVVPADVKKKRA